MKLKKAYGICSIHGWEESIQIKHGDPHDRKDPGTPLMCPECWLEVTKDDPKRCKDCARNIAMDIFLKKHERDHTS